ncbi:Cypemycin methyltransferase [Streptomyces sp. ADI96-02]|uniref:class I SAM-dependent methyltransferase n=1 Tax=Streptomyces sp. ADI96-02 TaxID=1522760 RepID=UPI000F556F7F|nr:class I SAM-dependent methyltransferase [Streptomyces sp. ADI96-02]RPK62768.1 Cypemycin methyltransferase [Streptomyces sp. ADI96-02]
MTDTATTAETPGLPGSTAPEGVEEAPGDGDAPAPAGGFGAAVAAAYSDVLAEVYDDVYPSTPDLDDIATYLLTIASPGASVLELGVGTGRVALPLAERGFQVHGVESSRGMLDRLAAKDPEGRITPVHGDFSGLDLGRSFDVVLAPFNVLCCAMAVDEQIAMAHAMARHVAADGHVVIETFDPSDYHVQKRNEVTTHPVGTRGALIESASVLPASQNMMLQSTLLLDGDAPRTATTVMRYVWPGELDLLGAIAGLELVARYAGWREQPFDGGDSRKMCVSVFRPLA